MTGLQETFYIIGIAYMGLSLIIIFGVLIAMLVIRAKIISIENMIKDKLHTASALASAAGEVISTVKKVTSRGK